VNLYGDLKHERRQTSRLSGCGKAVDACLSGPSAPFDLFAECPLWVGSSHSSIFLHEKYFRQNRKSFSTNRVKVGLGSTSNTGERGKTDTSGTRHLFSLLLGGYPCLLSLLLTLGCIT
jgi:hypothetical protein